MQDKIEELFQSLCSVDMLDIVSDASDLNPINVSLVSTEVIVPEAVPYYDDSVAVAHTKGSAIYVQFDVADVPWSFLEPVLRDLLPQAIKAALAVREHQFKLILSAAIEDKVREYKSDIDANRAEVVQKELELANLHRKLCQDRIAADALKGTVGQWKKRGHREFGYLMKLIPNKYREIYVSDDELVALTYPVSIRHEGSMYEIGEFEIRITLKTGLLVISNQTHKVEDYDHPHINDGNSCLGNIGKGLLRMLAEFELFGALELIHAFLHSYNPDSPYKKIECWDPDYNEETEDRYVSCHEDNSGYSCVECGDEACPFYEYAFQDCLDNSTEKECRDCSYQCHLGRRWLAELLTKKGEADAAENQSAVQLESVPQDATMG